ncbi:MAG: hypothetical protein R2758_03755 [Bacteroidales bacterium]
MRHQGSPLLYASGVILAGMLVVAISRIIMYHSVKRGSKLMVWHYLAWVAAEIASMALFFTLFEVVILKDQRPFTELMGTSVQNTSLTLLLPYTFLWLWFAWREQNKAVSNHRATRPARPASDDTPEGRKRGAENVTKAF